MKICLIGHARSRSSLVLSYLANYYNLLDCDESYRFVDKTFVNKASYGCKLKKFTDQIFTNQNFIIKVWPRWMCSTVYVEGTEFLLDDLDYYFRFSDYDKIYITYRDPVDSICSLFLSEKFGYQYHGHRDNLKYYSNRKKVPNIIPDLDSNINYKSLLWEMCLIDHICEYLKSKKIKFVSLPFETAPNYLEENYPLPDQTKLTRPLPIYLGLNYRKTIRNYQDVENFVGKNKIQILSKINKFKFI